MTDLGVLHEDVNLAMGKYSTLEEIETACEKFQMKTLNNDYFGLSQTERLRKHNNYVSKMKTCIKLYMNLNEKLLKNLKVIKR